MAIKPNICVIQMSVNDMDAAIDFYQKIGFGVKGRTNYPDYIELDHVDADRFTFLLARVPNRVDDPYPDSSQTLINIEVEDLDEAISDLTAKGVSFLNDQPTQFAVGRFVTIVDPAGNAIELVEWEAQSEEATRKRALVQL